ncbi:hypothetical protein [Candidatus Villigracilis saccharophilus]|uniref:hypothetical protein n=1 Tax=Candidatus Villigracilis saccharophilus TaxID=3140684 RepID=UPI0031EE45EB
MAVGRKGGHGFSKPRRANAQAYSPTVEDETRFGWKTGWPQYDEIKSRLETVPARFQPGLICAAAIRRLLSGGEQRGWPWLPSLHANLKPRILDEIAFHA